MTTSANQPTTGDPAPESERFFVRIPNGQEFGPADRATILAWESQGRVNETCKVRSQTGSLYTDFKMWKETISSANPQSSSLPRFSSVNVFGDQIGRVDVAANQSTLVTQSRATTILILGVGSWILCLSILGAPVCAVIAIYLGVGELGRIHRGEVSSDNKPAVWIGLILGVSNLLFTLILLVFGLIAAIVS
ncbi:hypothetical protein SH449x_000641 [Pirellulaceae bacterium SH449]